VNEPEAAPDTDDRIRFLNVDLELVCHRAPDSLLAHWGGAVVVLRDSVDGGMHNIWLELEREYESPEQCIVDFLDLVEALPAELRAFWDGCEDRCFNVGVQCGRTGSPYLLELPSHALVRLVAADARFVVTIYAFANIARRI
jgi:hypothetical protein